MEEQNVFVKNKSIIDAMTYMLNSICDIVNGNKYLGVFHSVMNDVLLKI